MRFGKLSVLFAALCCVLVLPLHSVSAEEPASAKSNLTDVIESLKIAEQKSQDLEQQLMNAQALLEKQSKQTEMLQKSLETALEDSKNLSESYSKLNKQKETWKVVGIVGITVSVPLIFTTTVALLLKRK